MTFHLQSSDTQPKQSGTGDGQRGYNLDDSFYINRESLDVWEDTGDRLSPDRLPDFWVARPTLRRRFVPATGTYITDFPTEHQQYRAYRIQARRGSVEGGYVTLGTSNTLIVRWFIQCQPKMRIEMLSCEGWVPVSGDQGSGVGLDVNDNTAIKIVGEKWPPPDGEEVRVLWQFNRASTFLRQPGPGAGNRPPAIIQDSQLSSRVITTTKDWNSHANELVFPIPADRAPANPTPASWWQISASFLSSVYFQRIVPKVPQGIQFTPLNGRVYVDWGSAATSGLRWIDETEQFYLDWDADPTTDVMKLGGVEAFGNDPGFEYTLWWNALPPNVTILRPGYRRGLGYQWQDRGRDIPEGIVMPHWDLPRGNPIYQLLPGLAFRAQLPDGSVPEPVREIGSYVFMARVTDRQGRTDDPCRRRSIYKSWVLNIRRPASGG